MDASPERNFEALIDGDLRLVGFDLGKIRAQSGVEHQGILDDDFGIEPARGRSSSRLKWGAPPGRSSRLRNERREP